MENQIGITIFTFVTVNNSLIRENLLSSLKPSRVDNAFLISLVGFRPEKYFWIGLSNQKNIDNFVWTNTNSVRFTHWNTEMPGTKKVEFLSIRYVSERLHN